MFSLRRSELSANKTYKSVKRSINSTALLDKSNAQTLQERKVEKIPGSDQKRKLHKARKLFTHPKIKVDDESNKSKNVDEYDELDLILMDMHQANVTNIF